MESDQVLLERANTYLHNLKHLRIARYRIEDVNHGGYVRGGFSEVKQKKLRGRRFLIGYKMVAVKSLGLEGSRSERIKCLVAFARELHVWSQTHHPNILPLKGFIYNEADPDIKEAWIITRWHWRGDINQYLTPAIPPERRLELAMDTALAVAWLHSQKICHGDIKAENTLVSDSGKAMFCDFGTAKVLATVKSGLTAPGPPHKTPRYASPELFRDESTDNPLPRDVWAWGCLVLKIVTDLRPHHQHQDYNAIHTAITSNEQPADIANLPLDPVLEFTKSIILNCWEIEPGLRPAISLCRAMLSQGFFKATASPKSAKIMTQYRSRGSGWDMTHVPGHGLPFLMKFSSISEKSPSGKYRLSPNGEYIAVVGYKSVLLYSTTSSNVDGPRVLLGTVGRSDPDAKAESSPADPTEICFSNDGSVLAVGFEGGLIQLWKFPSMSDPVDLKEHEGEKEPISSLLFVESRLVSTSVDKTLRVWDTKSRSVLHGKTTPDLPRSLASSPHHNLVIVVYEAGLEIIDVTSGIQVTELSISTQAVAFTPDGNEFITGSKDPGLQTWDLRPFLGHNPERGAAADKLEKPRLLYGTQSSITSLTVSSDGLLAASASWAKDDVALWDIQGGRMEASLTGDMTVGTPRISFIPSSKATGGKLVIATSDALRLVEYTVPQPEGRKGGLLGPFLQKAGPRKV